MLTLLRSTVAGLLLVLLCIGCTEDGGLQPTPPPPPQQPPPIATSGFIWGHVIEGSGVCIIDAVVEIVAGPNAGQKVVQKESCSAWDEGGFEFKDLPLGVTIRLRATKEGYQPKEVETMAVTHGSALNIWLVQEKQ